MQQIVLLIEDDKMIQRLLSRMIKRSGFNGQVEVFDNSKEVFDFIAQCSELIVIAFMDTSIHPEGDEALGHALKAQVPNIKLVASSGHSEDDLRGPHHFGTLDLDGVLSKPFGMQDVKDLLSTLNLI
jgi:CheY-like chemotaxis protein